MDLLDRLLDHDRWTTRQVLAICRTLPSQQLDAPLAIGPGSVGATLRHMIANVQVWTDLMYGRPARPTNAVANAVASAGVEELPAVFDALYADFAAIARKLRDDGRLDELYLDVLDDPPTRKSFGGTIAHVITHNMHHRAEILNMLGRLNVPDLPEGDVLSWEAQTRA